MKRHEGRNSHRRASSMQLALLASLPGAALIAAPPVIAQEQQFLFNIESQPLSAALLSFGRQADLSVLAPTDLVAGKVSHDLKGQFSAASALDQLLAGSGLTYVFVQPKAVRIIAVERAAIPQPLGGDDDRSGRDVVVVTGTNIRGVYSQSSPIDIYTRTDIARTGATTTEQFVAKLPQNLGTLSQNAPGAHVTSPNLNAVTAIDIRGLGIGTTLTLLNGHRMALSNSGQAADVSFIPLSAIERVDVLTDGASAIYGSDAVGGVVNFILRDDYEGSETRVSAGGVSSGGMRQAGFGHTTGMRWGDGHGLLAYDHHTASALKTTDRPYAVAAGPGVLTPVDSRHNLFATGSQELSEQLTLDIDVGASWRKVKNSRANLRSPPPHQTMQYYSSQSDLLFGNVELDYVFDKNFAASVTASYSALDTDGDVSLVRVNLDPAPTTFTAFDSRNSQLDVMGKLDGILMTLPGGDVRFSVGGGMLSERYRGVNPATSEQGAGTLGRRATYGFAEANIPLVSPEQGVPLVNQLTLNVAARYTNYDDASTPRLSSDFGDSVDPKIGISWAPSDELSFRATYGSSFRAPSLTQIDPAGGAHYLFPIPVEDNPAIVIGMVGYPVPDLGPETADSYTLGFDFRSQDADGFHLSATYYSIDYTNRIGEAPTAGLDPFTTPGLLPDVIYRPPSVAFIEETLRATPLLVNLSDVDISDAAAGAAALFARDDVWMYDVRLKNLAVSRQQGIDLSVRKDWDIGWADLQVGANLSHILKYEQQGSPTADVLSAVDVPGQPADWRGRGFLGISAGELNATLSVNYTDNYTNPLAPAGQRAVDSWTTVDVALSYDFGQQFWGTSTRAGISIQNAFDADPPFLHPGVGSSIVYAVGFDPANANPLGRFVTLSLTQEW